MGFKTVLIVDDSKLARVTLKKKLEAHNLVVEVVDSAEQAYGCLPSLNPDIIFMDHLMPGIDGFEATQHIRQMPGFAATPIVMCTGKDHDGYLQEALAIGANFILSKPPVDEALDAILASAAEPALAPAPAADVADFMSGHDELLEHQAAEPVDVMPVPETDMADFMAEPVEEVEVAAVPVFTPPEAAGMAASDVERICQQIIAAERAIIINNVLSAIPAPKAATVVNQVAGVDADEVARICEDIIATERNAIIHDVLASVPAPAIPDMSEVRNAGIDMESVLSTVNATVTHQLAVNASAVKNSIFEQIQQDMGNVISEKIAESIDRDIQGILELRLNVMLAEKMAATNSKISTLEQLINDKTQLLNSSADLFASDSPLKLSQPNNISDRVTELYEKHIALQEQLKKFQMLSLVAVGVAVAAIVIGLL